ncbi:MAG: outer membrane lipoprotein-sorting protein [Mariprofundaceae bacterium]|nr:outer membrane lipoprotein-sorting protein [Mariprofundaceae bacterium]
MLIRCLVTLLLLCLPQLSFAEQEKSPMNAKNIIQKVQKLMRSNTSTARYTMQIQTPDWQRSIRFDAWDDRLSKRFFIRVLAPRKEKDTAWLKADKNLWMYLPKLERDIRIPASMMLSSWMGSDFTNDDLVKMDSVVEDYHHRILSIDAYSVIIESIAKPDAPVVWGKIIHTVAKNGTPLSDDYYDEHGKHIRHLGFSEVENMDGRRIPTRWVMSALQKQDHRTVLKLEKATFDREIPNTVFTRGNLRQRTSMR